MLKYEIKADVRPEQIAELRKAVGWNGMVNSYKKSLSYSYFYICCFDGNNLVGFLDVVSNRITDAYIQDVIVNPNYQRKGIGTKLMNMAIDKIKHDGVYAISVLFDEKLVSFYKKFGFYIMMAGQMNTREED
jgi:ribosomal protein S18 acetylase RimI-like enzyme